MNIHPFPPVPPRKPELQAQEVRRHGHKPHAAAGRQSAEPDSGLDRVRHRRTTRQQVIRAFMAVLRCYPNAYEAEEIYEEFLDGLDDFELEDDLYERPVDDIVAEICDDLGIADRLGMPPRKRDAAAAGVKLSDIPEAQAELERMVAQFFKDRA